jgi:hypothetical protein
MPNKVCATCAFFRPTDDELGECRRHAPRTDAFPTVARLTWCGDWASNDLEYDSNRDFGTAVERDWRQSFSDREASR